MTILELLTNNNKEDQVVPAAGRKGKFPDRKLVEVISDKMLMVAAYFILVRKSAVWIVDAQ